MKSIDVVAAIICRGGMVLAAQRGYGEHAGKWEFPGGKVEPGETPEEALVREIAEELNVTIAVGPHFATIDYDYATFHLHMRCYLARMLEGEPHLIEHRAAKWVGASTIGDLDWLPADVKLVEDLKRSIPPSCETIDLS